MATVTWRDVQATLGRTLTTLQQQQADKWITQARTIIGARAVREATTLDGLDQDILAMVVTEAVANRMKRPDDATQVQVQVDDAQTTRRYESATGQIEITEDWWDILFPSTSATAFSIGFES
jgi:YesN/AraC family two-component response regulator